VLVESLGAVVYREHHESSPRGTVPPAADPDAEWDKDIVDLRRLGSDYPKHVSASALKLNFAFFASPQACAVSTIATCLEEVFKGGMTPSTERGVAGLASKRLDPLSMAMDAIPHQGVDSSVSDVEVRTLVDGTGEALCIHPFRCSPPAFDLAPGAHRQRRWLHNR